MTHGIRSKFGNPSFCKLSISLRNSTGEIYLYHSVTFYHIFFIEAVLTLSALPYSNQGSNITRPMRFAWDPAITGPYGSTSARDRNHWQVDPPLSFSKIKSSFLNEFVCKECFIYDGVPGCITLVLYVRSPWLSKLDEITNDVRCLVK